MYTRKGKMDINEIKRENARRIARELAKEKGSETKGFAELARKIGRPKEAVSQYLGKGSRRNIGPKWAKLIEDAGGKHRGWLSIYHGDEDTDTTRTPGGVNMDLLIDALIRSEKEIRGLSLSMTDDERAELLARTVAAVYACTEDTGGTTLVDPSFILRSLLPRKS